MQTRFFRFPDMASSFALAQAAGLTALDDNNEPALARYTHRYALDVVGVVYAPTGQMLRGEDGQTYPEQAPVEGWHVNARILSGDPLPESFAEFEVFPESPSRDFA